MFTVQSFIVGLGFRSGIFSDFTKRLIMLSSLFSFLVPSPYCKIKVDNKAKETITDYKTANPEWDCSVIFYSKSRHPDIIVEVNMELVQYSKLVICCVILYGSK